jgi:hypothetical protein
MDRCKKCGDYSGDFIFCPKCSSENMGHPTNQTSPPVNATGGFSSFELGRHYNMVKGRIAETLIEELFLSLDWNVFRYGMENTVPGVMKLLMGVKSDVAQDIRGMPDFVVQDKYRNFYYFEVKFRASGNFSIDELNDDYPYLNAYFIVVSRKHIRCITYQELKNGQKITPMSNHLLGDRNEFNFNELDKEKIRVFCGFAENFFKGV